MLMTLCQRGQRSGEAHGNRNLLLLEVTTSETELGGSRRVFECPQLCDSNGCGWTCYS